MLFCLMLQWDAVEMMETSMTIVMSACLPVASLGGGVGGCYTPPLFGHSSVKDKILSEICKLHVLSV